MSELYRETHGPLNASAEVSVLSYAYIGAQPREVIARVNLGSVLRPIAGNGEYICRFYLNGTLVSPDALTTVGAGVTRTILISRSLPIESGDAVEVKVTGRATDIAIDTVASLRDATPVTAGDVLGTGTQAVDHNRGGADTLTYRTGAGAGISGAEVRIYSLADYNADRRSVSYLKFQTVTDADGRWARAAMLPSGSYTIIFYKSGGFGPDRIDITI